MQPVVVNQASQVEGGVVQPGQEQPPHHQVSSYYAPAGLITVVGGEQQVGPNKPIVGAVRNYEQYGQPESASIPPNYKPFGSWGLYIGGNPADGYYTNYYKALSNSVDKQQQQAGEPAKPIGPAAFSPVPKQASSSPYVGADYYPFAYSPAELNSGPRVPVDASVPPTHPQYVTSPVQSGQVYGAPPAAANEPSLSYADSYATKKVGAAAFAQTAAGPAKGYQTRQLTYAYPSAGAVAQPSAPGQQQVVAYPVPVGSQIVGSQPGVDGAFAPYGVHAFTRYAVKPTVVSPEQSYYYSVHSPASQYPAYKQQAPPQVGAGAYPSSYYGYPVNQLHYSPGAIVPGQHGPAPGAEYPSIHHSPIQPGQVEAASERSESEEKLVGKPQQQQPTPQKRA